jgi:hypothetical protein
MTSHHSEYLSQRGNTPASVAALLESESSSSSSSSSSEEPPVMAAPGSQEGSQARGSQLPQKPIFQAVDGDAPTRAELVHHANEVRTYVGNQKFLLQYLGVTPDNMPPDPVTIIPPALS